VAPPTGAATNEERLMFTIDDDVPLPPTARSWAIYPWDQMQVGQSFEVPGGNIKSLASGAHKAGKVRGCKFVVRPTEAGCRVWRIA
jgi:hypothetical protein